MLGNSRELCYQVSGVSGYFNCCNSDFTNYAIAISKSETRNYYFSEIT